MPLQTYRHRCGHVRTVILGEPHPLTSPGITQYLIDQENASLCPECREQEMNLPDCDQCGAQMETDGIQIYCPYCGMDDGDEDDIPPDAYNISYYHS